MAAGWPSVFSCFLCVAAVFVWPNPFLCLLHRTIVGGLRRCDVYRAELREVPCFYFRLIPRKACGSRHSGQAFRVVDGNLPRPGSLIEPPSWKGTRMAERHHGCEFLWGNVLEDLVGNAFHGAIVFFL